MSGEVAFGCAISEDRQRGSIVAAGRSDAGKVLVDLAPFLDELTRQLRHPRFMVARMEELCARHDPVAVVVNPKSQSATLVKQLADAGIIVVPMSTEDVAVAHGEFLDLVYAGLLEHLEQKPLTDAVRASQQRPLSGAKAWEYRLDVDQSPLIAATGAVWGLLRWEELSRPAAWSL